MTEKISTISVYRGYLIPDLQAPRKSWVRTFGPQSLALLGITALGLTACQNDWGRRPDASATPAPAAQTTNLSPAHWPASDLDEFVALEDVDFPGKPEASGHGGAITGSYHPLAQRAGLEALAQGGSSVDAAMTAAMVQVTAGGGAVISFFGIMTLIHYDAASGEIHYMNAGWNAVAGEDDPMSIPGSIGGHGDALYGTDEPSGRTALVGGFMRGVESAHGRFGKLPFESLFEPSIYIAETGIPFGQKLNSYLEPRKEDLARLPASKAHFIGADGEWLEPGDHFTQPALAKTLRAIQSRGVDYMYTGPWAERAVAAVQADGGKMTMADLAAYEVTWGEVLSTDYRGYTVYANGAPSYGGANMLEALNMGESAGILELGHWSRNAESFRRVSELLNAGNIPFIVAFAPQMLEQKYPGMDFSDEARTTQGHADKLWAQMDAGNGLAQWAKPSTNHSDTVVAIDQWGNMTAVVHSINCVVWGKTAIIVDGVSIGDPAVSQKAIIAQAGPGNRVPDPTELGLVVKDGEPVLAFSSMAMGLHLETFQSLTNVLGFGMSPKAALDAPSILYWQIDGIEDPSNLSQTVRVMRGDFPAELLEETGLPYKLMEPEDRRYSQGLWVGVARDPKTGQLTAASHPYTNGRALALD